MPGGQKLQIFIALPAGYASVPGMAEQEKAKEQSRLAALYSYNILDTSAEQAFDDLVRIASHICQTPISLISLIDSNRQWFKARIGMEPQETHRDIAFCAEAIKTPDLMVVEDATADPRFQDNPLVIDDPEIRFYAGAPLITPEGHALGTLCVIDREKRKISEEQQDLLQRLARQVMNQMELRRRIRQEKITTEALQQSLGIQRAMFDSANLSIIATDLDGTIQTFNQGASRMLGYDPEEVVGKTDPRIFHDSHEIVRRAIELGKDLGRMVEPGFEVFVAQCRETKHADEREWTYIRKDGSRFPVLLSITPVIKEDRIAGYLGIGRDLTETNRLKEQRDEMSEEILRANKLLEAELEEASIRHKHLVEASPEMIFSMDLDGTIRSMNQRVHGLLGYNADEVVGKSILELLFSGSSQFNFEGELLLDRMKNMADVPRRIEMSLPFETRAGNLIELYVTLDYVSLGWPMVFGRAIPNQEDVLSQYVLSSSRELQIGNDIQLIDEISKSIAEEASRCLDEEERMGITLGIREMLMNAIEHGNLGITFEEKSLALEEDRLFDLIRERQKEAAIRQKRIRVGYTFNQKELSVHIEDEGQGFDTEKMLGRNIKDVAESRRMHGRGIRITKEMFDEIRYTGKGNRVILRKLFE